MKRTTNDEAERNEKKGLNNLELYLNDMEIINEIRPVEALHLLDFVGKEKINQENTLAATLAYLTNKEYIFLKNRKFPNTQFSLTNKGKYNKADLRPYEIKCLEAIADENEDNLVYISNNFNFRELLTQKEFFRKQQRKMGWWIFKQTTIDYLPTEKYEKAIKGLDKLKERISSAKQKSLDKDLMSMSYAFPSLDLDEEFLKYAEDIIQIVG